jgi:hypothetical protein
MRLHCLLAYDPTGAVVATLDHMVARDDEGNVVGLIDFAAHEAAGGEHTDIWMHHGAAGSKVWPEWLGGQAHSFRVELDGSPGAKHIAALIHRDSGHRRERDAIEAAIAAVPDHGSGKDIRHIVGGPGRPLALDDKGRTATVKPSGTPSHIPLIGGRNG